jgi:hypothetical protein
MNDTLQVGDMNGAGQLFDQSCEPVLAVPQGGFRRDGTTAGTELESSQFLCQGRTIDIFQGQKRPAFMLADFMHLHNAGMLHPG